MPEPVKLFRIRSGSVEDGFVCYRLQGNPLRISLPQGRRSSRCRSSPRDEFLLGGFLRRRLAQRVALSTLYVIPGADSTLLEAWLEVLLFE